MSNLFYEMPTFEKEFFSSAYYFEVTGLDAILNFFLNMFHFEISAIKHFGV